LKSPVALVRTMGLLDLAELREAARSFLNVGGSRAWEYASRKSAMTASNSSESDDADVQTYRSVNTLVIVREPSP
jgi:hypothetical protein